MAQNYSVEIREQAVSLVDAGESIGDVAKRLGVHPQTLDSWLRLRARTGSLEPRSSRPGVLDENQRGTLRRLVELHPAARLRDLVEMLVQAGGARVDAALLCRELRKMGFVRKKVPPSRRVSPEEPTGRPGGYRTPAGPRERKQYPSDLTDAQWALIAPFIPIPKSGGRPALHDRRAIVDAILYVARTGCQWRALPHDFPPWSTVYDLFRQWRSNDVWEHTNTALRERCRAKAGRDPTPSAAVIDSQVAKTTEKGGAAATMVVSASRDASATSSSTSRASCLRCASNPPTSPTLPQQRGFSLRSKDTSRA